MAITDAAAFGQEIRMAAAKETTWGTGVAITDVITFLTEDINRNQQFLQSEYNSGRVGREQAIASVKEAAGQVGFEAVYDTIAGDPFGWELILLAAMGAGTYDGVNSLTQYTLANSLDESLTIAMNKTVSAWEMVGAKCSQLTLTGQVGGKVTGNANFVGKTVYLTGDAGITNSAAAIDALAPTAKPNHVLLQEGIFRIGTVAGGALSATEQVAISEFELTIDNALTDATFATPENTGHTDALFSIEHVRNNIRQITLRIVIPRYTANTFFGWADGDTLLQADLVFDNGSESLAILMPTLKITESPTAPTSGPGAISHEIVLTALVNGGTNTNMTLTDATAIANEMAIEVTSNRTAAP